MRRCDEAATLDDRQAAVAETGVKALIPIDRPFLDYVLHAAAEAGFRRVCLVVGPGRSALREYYEPMKTRRIQIEFAVQQEPKGTADAVAATEAFAAGDPLVVLNSDTYYPVAALRQLRQQEAPATALFDHASVATGGNIPEQRLRAFAVGRIDHEGFLQEIIEKPDADTWASLPRPIRLSLNCWLFGPAIFEACRSIGPSQRGEYEIPAAVQYAVDNLGERFHVVTIHEAVLDLSSRQDVAAVAARLAGTEVVL